MNPPIKRMETHKDKTLQRTQQQQTSFSRLMGTRHYFSFGKNRIYFKKKESFFFRKILLLLTAPRLNLDWLENVLSYAMLLCYVAHLPPPLE